MRGAAWFLAVSAEWIANAPLHVHLQLGPGADGCARRTGDPRGGRRTRMILQGSVEGYFHAPSR